MTPCEAHNLNNCLFCHSDEEFQEVVTLPIPTLQRISIKCRWCDDAIARNLSYQQAEEWAINHYNERKHRSFRLTSARLWIEYKAQGI